jgi:hypothetical protein
LSGIRVTTTDLTPDEAVELAAAIGDTVRSATATYAG